MASKSAGQRRRKSAGVTQVSVTAVTQEPAEDAFGTPRKVQCTNCIVHGGLYCTGCPLGEVIAQCTGSGLVGNMRLFWNGCSGKRLLLSMPVHVFSKEALEEACRSSTRSSFCGCACVEV